MTPEDRKVTRIHEWVDRTVFDADRIIAVSNRSREDVIKAFKGISKKTVVIPNGVDLDIFKPSKKSPPVVFWVGRFSKEKGIGLIPEIVDRILKKNKRYKFIMVAPKNDKIEEFPELSEIKKKIDELIKKYKNRFIWVDQPLSSKELDELHEKAGVYIQPSLYENAPLTILEAMACGEAIVATKVGGIPEQLGKTGLLAKVDAKDISNKAIRLLKNRDLRIKYSRLAAERAKQFSWMAMTKKTLELYKEIINERKNGKKRE
jgi:starch synthase